MIRAFGQDQLVQPREVAQAPFAPHQAPSLTARRALLLMIGEAAADGFTSGTYRVSKKIVRQNHKGNERISDIMDEVLAIKLQIPGISSRGHASIIKSVLFDEIVEETDDGDSAWIEFSFSRRAKIIFGASDVYAVLNRTALLAFEGKYAITLYQLGCLYVSRRMPEITLKIPALREQLGVPPEVYRDFTDLRRRVLAPAIEEIEHIGHFRIAVREHTRGRKVEEVTLGFWLKDPDSINEAARELDVSRVGRKARRQGKVESTIAARDRFEPPPLPPLDDEVTY